MFKTKIHFLTITFFLISWVSSYSQTTWDISGSAVINRLKDDIYALASEEMEGREAGTPGEKKAANYIKSRMKEIGLMPVFGDSYLQDFDFFSGYSYDESSFLKIGNQHFKPGVDFFILPQSADKEISAEGIYVGSGLEIENIVNDFEDLEDISGKIFFIDYYAHPTYELDIDYDISALLRMKTETAIKKGAAGIVFINPHGEFDDPTIITNRNVARENIPVIFAREQVFEFFSQQEIYTDITLKTNLLQEYNTGFNVAGYLDNNSDYTVVIGGHFDHLGYGGPTSRDLNDSVIHYGADDNASGTAGVLEAARYYSSTTDKQYNFLFIAFSAEEKGLIGSRYFTESGSYDLSKANFMFNFDMIGRLQNNRLILIGTGTSPSWDEIIENSKPEHFNIVSARSGIGGSDHASFYIKNIPAIFFHTGLHEDYHASTDTPDKVNYEGTLEILQFAYEMISYSLKLDRLEFTPTPVTETRRRRSESVTLGIMPDHTYEGRGVKIMAIVNDRPAEKAGLKQGDIIIGIQDTEITEIHSYMRALENLSQGQKIMVLIFRDEEKLMIEVKL